MSDQDLRHTSVALYRFLCQSIVGSEEIVKTRRMLMATIDNLTYNTILTSIISGSIGEGLEMQGSDYDIMYVLKDLQVYEHIANIPWNPFATYFTMVTEDTNLGFAKLLLVYSNDEFVRDFVTEFEGDLYLSNSMIKSFGRDLPTYDIDFAPFTEVDHGPCLSDKDGILDLALCVHSKSWISQAVQWITRPNQSWPSDDVKSKIIGHGVLFVPVGVKGSRKEEIEWRISFSVGEKLLFIYTHTTFMLCRDEDYFERRYKYK